MVEALTRVEGSARDRDCASCVVVAFGAFIPGRATLLWLNVRAAEAEALEPELSRLARVPEAEVDDAVAWRAVLGAALPWSMNETVLGEEMCQKRTIPRWDGLRAEEDMAGEDKDACGQRGARAGQPEARRMC